MKREDMKVGMRVEYDNRHGGWPLGIIRSIPAGDLPELAVIKTPSALMLLARFDDEIELPGTAMKREDIHHEAIGEDIARMVYRACGVTWAKAIAKRSFRNGFKGGLRRTARLAHARDIAVYALRGEGYSYPAIARIIGYADHTAAMLAYRRAQSKLAPKP